MPVDHTESVQLRECMWVYNSGDDMNGGYAYSHSLMWELPEILTYFYKYIQRSKLTQNLILRYNLNENPSLY